jgi:hypothetical protein
MGANEEIAKGGEMGVFLAEGKDVATQDYMEKSLASLSKTYPLLLK